MTQEFQRVARPRISNAAGFHAGPVENRRKTAWNRSFLARVSLALIGLAFFMTAQASDTQIPSVTISSPTAGSTLKGTVAISVKASTPTLSPQKMM